MPIVLGVDLGTTKITCIAVDARSGAMLAVESAINDANITRDEDRALGRSEWRADRILIAANRCLSNVAKHLGSRVNEVVGIGVTGQQHGVVLVDATMLQPVTPLVNWQDRRALQLMPDGKLTWVSDDNPSRYEATTAGGHWRGKILASRQISTNGNASARGAAV